MGIRLRQKYLATLFAGALASIPSTEVFASDWTVVRSPSGTPVARLETGDALVPAMELACDGARVGVGIQARVGPQIRRLPITFAGDGGRPSQLVLGRLGALASFAGHLPDTNLLDGLSGGWSSWRLSVGGRPLSPSLPGASAVIRSALSRCYAPQARTVAAPLSNTGVGTLPFRRGVYVDTNDQFGSDAIGANPQSCARYNQTIIFDGRRFVHRFYGGDHRGAVWTRTIVRAQPLAQNRFKVFEAFDDSTEKFEREDEGDPYGMTMWQDGETLYWRSADPRFEPPTIELRFCPELTMTAAASRPLEALPQSPRRAALIQSGTSDEEAVRTDVANIYGFRDGRPIAGEADGGEGHFSPRLQALLDACLAAIEGSGSRPDGTGSYDIVGDQGCGGDVFGFDERGDDDDTDFRKIRVAVQRLANGAIDARVTPGERTLRYRKLGGRWLIDEVTQTYEGSTIRYSDVLREQTAELLQLPRLRRKQR